ncbi:MAG TPA: GAF and ANTAR domain-containing protein [Pilimelia sp.]|nr:GAF and ANTAR domain-containing protein [Pilimelia sp.]
MATPHPPSAHAGRPVDRPLVENLITLAGTPDDASQIDTQLAMIARLVADIVAPVAYASVTARREGAFTTVATTSELAVAVDHAQYADQSGPCLTALETGVPVGVEHIAATMVWPGFRDMAFGLGLRASLSIPVFAGSGAPVAALNLYGHEPSTMAQLTARVWQVYDPEFDLDPGAEGRRQRPPELDEGSEQLVAGLADALTVRALIQRAIGVVMAIGHHSPDEAYLVLRLRAAEDGGSIAHAARALLDEPR